MVHEKYIKKNGKVYGPYYYKSKRVGDKVISEYVGEKKERKKIPKKVLLSIVFSMAAIVLFLLIFFSIQSGIFSGKVVSDFNDNSFDEGNAVQSPITGNAVKTDTLDIPDVVQGDFIESSRIFKSWIIVTFKLGSESIEYSYSNSLSQAELDFLIERDRALWLDKISN